MPLFELLAKIEIKGAPEARKHLEDVREAAHTAAGALSSRLGSAVQALSGHLLDATKNAALMGGAISVAIGGSAFAVAAKMDSLTRGLASVSTNAADLQGQLTSLREVAKLPGLGFEEAVQGSVALQAAGLSADLAQRSLMAFGNALATVGKGKAELDGVTLALGQIASKGKVSAEEINQLNERVPQIRRAMQAAFGTADTEALGKMGIDATQFISGVVREFEKLPRVSGGVQNSIENLQDAIKGALLPLGKGIADLFTGLGGTSDTMIAKFTKLGTTIGEVFSAIGKSGVLEEVGRSIASLFGMDLGKSFQENLIRGFSVVASVIKNLPEIGRYAADYFSKVWDTAAKNIGIAFSNVAEVVKSAFSNVVSDIKADFLTSVGQMLQAIPHLPGMPVGLFAMGQTMLDKAKAERDFTSVPKVQVMADLPQFSASFAPILKDADRFAETVTGKLKPFSMIPEGLNFGGGGLSSAAGQNGVFAQWDKYLADIERNTKGTRDALDARKVMGGGELANMGVTLSERSPDPYTRSIDSSLKSAIHRLVRADQAGTSRRGVALAGR